MRLALDARRKRRDFASPRKAEQGYARQLRQLSRQIGTMVDAHPEGDMQAMAKIEQALTRFGEAIEPWARSVAQRMLDDVAKREEREWASYAKEMGRALRQEIREAPTGLLMQERLAEQVDLITSLPREAAERVRKLTVDGLAMGTRPAEIAAEILRTGDVTESRAMLIARTETARTASMLTQVRAEHIGCTHFQWLTVGDSRVRPSHRKMNGKVCEFANPPIVDGQPLIPGQTYNCRCTLLPVLPED